MIALDTNVVVRVVVADDRDQLERALALMRSGRLFLSKTVLLETEWVLRYSYELGREAILKALRLLLGLGELEVEDRRAVLLAISLYGGGMDFGDALHLASSTRADSFATFDRRLALTAAAVAAQPPIELLKPH